MKSFHITFYLYFDNTSFNGHVTATESHETSQNKLWSVWFYLAEAVQRCLQGLYCFQCIPILNHMMHHVHFHKTLTAPLRPRITQLFRNV